MYVTIEDSLPDLSIVSFGLGADFYADEFYNQFESDDDRIIASPDNVNKLISLCEMTSFGQKIVDDYCQNQGLFDLTDERTLSLKDLKIIAGCIITIPVYYQYRIIDPVINDFITKSQQDFFEKIKNDSIRKVYQVKVKKVFVKKTPNLKINVHFFVEYIEDECNLEYFEKLGKNTISKIRVDSNGSCHVALDTFYSKELDCE